MPYSYLTLTVLLSVAGTIGAEKYGVASLASLINVKVLGKGSDIGHIAQAILDIIKEHNENKKKSGNGFWMFRGSVINMSLTWQGNAFGILYQLIDANDAGISVFAAAGNDNKDAKSYYPCANVQTRCIAAVDNTYNKAKFSNYGGVVNFIAPGKDIRKYTRS
jgi:subtilisin family serine protease